MDPNQSNDQERSSDLSPKPNGQLGVANSTSIYKSQKHDCAWEVSGVKVCIFAGESVGLSLAVPPNIPGKSKCWRRRRENHNAISRERKRKKWWPHRWWTRTHCRATPSGLKSPRWRRTLPLLIVLLAWKSSMLYFFFNCKVFFKKRKMFSGKLFKTLENIVLCWEFGQFSFALSFFLMHYKGFWKFLLSFLC